MSQLSDFLNEYDLTPEQVIAESRAAERLDKAARDKYVQRADARRKKKPYDEVGAEKPGALRRGVSKRTMDLALAGQPITRINRKKITRAVHNLLRGENEVTVHKLFADVRSRNHKKPEASED
jgi:hypothetical protein